MPDQRSLNSLYWFSTDCSTRTRHISLICFLCLLTPELESKCRTVVANNFENYLQMFRWFSPSDELRKTCFFNISVNSYKADLVLLSTKLHSFWTQRRDSNIESVPSKHKLHSWLCCSSHHYSLRSEIVWRHQTWTITFRYKILSKIIWPSLCVEYFLVGCVWQVWGTLPPLPTLLRLRQSILTQPQHDQILFNAHTDQIFFYRNNTEIFSYLGVWLFDSFSWLCASYCSSDSCCLSVVSVMSDWRPAPADHDWLTYVAAQPENESRPRHEEAAADHEDARTARTSGEANWGHGPRPTHSNTIFRLDEA